METKLEVKCECGPTLVSKEKLENWYTPKESLTAEEEEVAGDSKTCEVCEGTGEVDVYTTVEGNRVWDGTRPCVCQEVYDDPDRAWKERE